MLISECCSAAPVGASEEMGICPMCKEHCEYIDDSIEGMTKEEAFIQWGTRNGHSKLTSDQFDMAQKIHDKDKEENPQDHEWGPKNGREHRGWATPHCKCGFAYSVDSSD